MIQTALPGTARYHKLDNRALLLLGVSRHQISEWHRRQIIQAPLGKHRGLGAPGHSCDVVEAAVIATLAHLRRAKYRLGTLAAVAPAVRRHYAKHEAAPGWLITDGERAWIDSTSHVVGIAAGLGKNAIVDLQAEWCRCEELLGENR